MTATAQTLLTAGATLQDLLDFSSFMNARDEDLFWKAVREINPTLCPDW